MYNYLIELMQLQHISYQKLSRSMGRSTPIIFNKLKGRTKLTVDEFVQICYILHVKPSRVIEKINYKKSY